MGFHITNLPDEEERKVLLPGDEGFAAPPSAPRELFGLTPTQMVAMGLTGEESKRRYTGVTEANISARSAYSQEMASEKNPPERLTAVMSGRAYNNNPNSQAPPDLPSLLLNSRIIYLGMPMVPAVTELMIAEFLFCNYDSPEKPVYLYINSSGSQTLEGQVAGMETEMGAIMDVMGYVQCPIHTVAVNKAYGNAALLLAAGVKGYRYAMPHATIVTHLPKVERIYGKTTDNQIHAKELKYFSKQYVRSLAGFTGKTVDEALGYVSRTRYHSPEQAIEQGLIDKVIPGADSVLEKKNYDEMLAVAQSRQQRG